MPDMSTRRSLASIPAERIAEATGLPTSRVRAVLTSEDSPVLDVVKVGGFLHVPVKELFA